MKSKERWIWTLILGASLGANALLYVRPAAADIEATHRYQQVFQNVLNYMRTLYVNEEDDQVLLTGAVRGMMAATGDPYTRFLTREEHQEFNNAEEGQKVGIGVEVTMKDDYPTVIAPVDGGPAQKAGILSGDRIISINGESTHKKYFGEILKLIAGETGTIVELEIGRQGFLEPIKVQVRRGFFNLVYCNGSVIEKEFGYVRLTQFYGEDSGTVTRFHDLLKEFQEKKVRGIIVDLRNNTGGLLSMAGTLTGYFLNKGDVIVRARGRDPQQERLMRAEGETGIVAAGMPIVVLVNRGSASASEIMAGALQDHSRAKILGTRTFGKASVQQIVRPLPDDTAAIITTQRYYTPKNQSLHGKGLTPDIDVPDLAPGPDESYYLYKIKETKFFETFRRNYPKYGPDLFAIFNQELKQKGWSLSPVLALFVLKQEYGALPASGPDMETDVQLARAIAELRSSPDRGLR